MNRENGFSLLELTLAMGLTMALTAAVFTMLNPSQGAFKVEPEVAGMQQRLRVAADTLYKDLLMAGAGVSMGTGAGSLGYHFAPVLPLRKGSRGDDPPGTYRNDTITLLYVPSTPAQSMLAADLTPSSTSVWVNFESNCPVRAGSCGFRPGMTILVFDDSGNYDTFTLESVTDSSAIASANTPSGAAGTTYKIGSTIVQVVSHTYYLKTDNTNKLYQLMHYDGTANANVPVVDHVVGLFFEYWGDAQPPVLRKPLSDPTGPWTTYGPRPPASDVSNGAGYPPGENCTFTTDPAGGVDPVPRLATLGAGGTSLVKLAAAQLADGPWCPDASNQNRFDADLLRIRKIAVTLRVESALDSLRGPAGALFTRGGSSTSGTQFLPDQQIGFQVSPRNLNLGR